MTVVTAGLYCSMVIKQDGSVWATGANTTGHLGDGSTTNRHVFIKVVSSDVISMALGDAHNMVLKQDGNV